MGLLKTVLHLHGVWLSQNNAVVLGSCFTEPGENANIYIVAQVSQSGRVLKTFHGKTPGQLIPTPSVAAH
jgi:hypothetical protein